MELCERDRGVFVSLLHMVPLKSVQAVAASVAPSFSLLRTILWCTRAMR